MKIHKKKSQWLSISIGILIIVLAAGWSFAATTGKIQGTIVDAESGEPLIGANIVVEGTNWGAAADLEGFYFIHNLPPGEYSVRASMIGYQITTQTKVLVSAGHTTELDFKLKIESIEGESVEIVAEREIVKMDMSSSAVSTTAEEMTTVPLVSSVGQFANLMAGIDGWSGRGGSINETAFLMDGLLLVDNMTNSPVALPNMSTVGEFNVIKGGFNAEYGNVRSGLVNITTKNVSDKYFMNVEVKTSPPQRMHRGPSVFDHKSYFLRPYLDTEDSLCWLGTSVLPDNERDDYPDFGGWINESERLLADDDPTNDRTPEECRDLYMWLKRAKGANELLNKYENNYDGPPREVDYANKPNWLIDGSFGGPVPFVDNTSFLLSYRYDKQMWGLPAHPIDRDAYKSSQTQLKVSHKVNSNLEISFDGMYRSISSLSNDERWSMQVGHRTPAAPMEWGGGIFYRNGGLGALDLYEPYANVPFDRTVKMVGLSIDHVPSPKTFYSVRLTYIGTQDDAPGRYLYSYGNRDNPLDGRVDNYIPQEERYDLNRDIGTALRDTTGVIKFGNTWVDEAPYGMTPKSDLYNKSWMEQNPFNLAGVSGNTTFNFSKSATINLKGDLTSQINRHHQIKTGLLINYDDLYSWYGAMTYPIHEGSGRIFWQAQPLRAGAYVQDKIEFEGMIANVGVRFDYSDARTDAFNVDRYSKYFMEVNKYNLTTDAPRTPAKPQFSFNPRFGLSHPISEFTKLFFNYGWFSGMPNSSDMYTINYGSARGIQYLGNPSLKMEQTVAYEFGVEQNIAKLFLLHISGYYKDISDETGYVSYHDFDGYVDYTTVENNFYRDIRGFEIELSKRWGDWFTGVVNYDYKVVLSGLFGRQAYYQDLRQDRISGMQDPYQAKPLPQPVARANVMFSTPFDWGPAIGKFKPLGDWGLSFLYSYRAGAHMTYDPLQTFKLYMNVQQKDYHNVDLRLSKNFKVASTQAMVYFEIQNLLDTKRLSGISFSDAGDYDDYMKSLHLNMYHGQEYVDAGFVGGDDRYGEFRDYDVPYDPWEPNPENDPEIETRNQERLKTKSYINMPNVRFLTFLMPRMVSFGIKFNF